MPNDRAPIEHQCLRKRGFGPHGLWCKFHDPDRLEALERAKDKKQTEQKREDAAVEKQGEAILARLGVEGDVQWNARTFRPDRALVISFGEAQKLVAKLYRTENEVDRLDRKATVEKRDWAESKGKDG